MKTTQLYDINLKEMRANVRERLTDKAQMVAEELGTVIGSNLLEAYSDNPMADNDKIPYYSQDDVKKMLRRV
jgi:hypothetical protein